MPKVLVVDDSLSVRKAVERALEARSIQVLSVATGSEAMERIEREEPDVVVCDVIMPDRDGYEICQFVKNHPRLGKTPVLLISGIVNNTVLERAARVQSNDVMRKPFAADELFQKIQALLPPSLPVVAAPAPELVEAAPVPVLPSFERAPRAPLREEPTPEPMALDLKASLGQFVAMPGVTLAALVDRDGYLIESAGTVGIEAEVAGALASCLAESSDGIGRELGQGSLQGMIMEYAGGTVLLHSVGSAAILAVILVDHAVLGKVRYYVKKALPDLIRAL